MKRGFDISITGDRRDLSAIAADVAKFVTDRTNPIDESGQGASYCHVSWEADDAARSVDRKDSPKNRALMLSFLANELSESEGVIFWNCFGDIAHRKCICELYVGMHVDVDDRFFCWMTFWRLDAQSAESLDNPGDFVSWVHSLPARVQIADGFTYAQPDGVSQGDWTIDARCRSTSDDLQRDFDPPDFTAYSDKGVPGYWTSWAPGDFEPVDDIPRHDLPLVLIAEPPAPEPEPVTFEPAARYEWDPTGPRADAFHLLYNPDEPAPFDGAVPVCFGSSWDGADAVWQDIEDPGAINVAEVDSVDVAELISDLWWDPEDDDLDGFWDGAPTWDGLTPLSNSPSAGLPEPFGPLRVVWVDAQRPADVPGVLGWPLPIGLVDLTAVLRSWEDRFGARAAVMGMGVLWLIIERPPTERAQLERLACEIAAVCPNAAEQCHSFAGFVDILAASNLWELFFD